MRRKLSAREARAFKALARAAKRVQELTSKSKPQNGGAK